MDDILNAKIMSRINKKKKTDDFLITLPIKRKLAEHLDAVTGMMQQRSGESITREELIVDAIEAYLEAADRALLEDAGISGEKAERFDTVVYPGRQDGFQKAFLGEHAWYYVRIAKERLNLSYIAIYETTPVKAIRYYGKIDKILPAPPPNKGKYIIKLDGAPIPLKRPILLGEIQPTSTRSPKYTTFEKLLSAKEYRDL